MPVIRRVVLAALCIASSLACLAGRQSAAQETVIVSEGPRAAAGREAAACGCRNTQRPPWHANVTAPGYGPAMPAYGTMFHADPRGQLCVRRQLHETGATMPSLFPRLHTWCTEGSMPTPRPPALPRCHNCGAPIEHGF